MDYSGAYPPELGDSPADLQSFVGEAIHVTANVASQLRSFSSFVVARFSTLPASTPAMSYIVRFSIFCIVPVFPFLCPVSLANLLK